jgi:UDP-2-acetamido-3-amino-2,3-dideoxy-glucuronate N-acetyltransferase
VASISVAVIGCGYWGKNLVRNFAELGSLVAVADANHASAEAMAVTYKVPARAIDEILADQSIVGVVIASSAVSHAVLAADALKAGKHVLVEKPLALTLAEAEALKKLAEQQGRALMVGHLMQYHPYYQELKRMVAAGEFGRLHSITSQRLNLGKIRTEENVLWSFAPHDLSMILGLVNETPKQVRAIGQSILTVGVMDRVTTQIEFPSGIQAEVTVSWLHPTKEQKLVVVGEKMMAVLDDTQPWDKKLALFRHRIEWQGKLPAPVKAEAEYVSLPMGEPLRRECQHFLDACVGNQVITDAAEGIRVLNLLAMAEEAMARREQMTSETLEIPGVFVHDTARVDAGATLGKGTKIWHFSHILKGVEIGEDCVIGQNVMIGPDVTVGARSKIQNNVSLYKGVTLEEGVFCGPSCVFTNVNTPRAEIERKDEYRPTRVGRAATIGANATIVCGHDIGEYALIGAGAVITKNVPPHALMVGNPAKQIGWVSHAGERLGADLTCPRDGRVYEVIKGQLRERRNEERAKKSKVG